MSTRTRVTTLGHMPVGHAHPSPRTRSDTPVDNDDDDKGDNLEENMLVIAVIDLARFAPQHPDCNEQLLRWSADLTQIIHRKQPLLRKKNISLFFRKKFLTKTPWHKWAKIRKKVQFRETSKAKINISQKIQSSSGVAHKIGCGVKKKLKKNIDFSLCRSRTRTRIWLFIALCSHFVADYID